MRGIFVSLFGLSLLAACSPVPIAGTYPVSVEQRMQSVSHWQFLAEQTIDEAAPRLPQDRPVFIGMSERGEHCTFCIAFNGYLRTALTHHGYAVSLAEDPRASAIHYSVQPVQFAEWKDRQAIPGLFTTLGFGAWLGTQAATHWGGGLSSAVAGTAIPAGVALDVANGALATPTDSELIVNIDVVSGGLEILRTSNNFYVAGVDLWQYSSPAPEAPGMIHPRVVGYDIYE